LHFDKNVGTTGTPKVTGCAVQLTSVLTSIQAVAIPHIAVIANVLQMASHAKVNEDYAPWKDRRYRPGDVASGGRQTSLQSTSY
jgi:flavin reductase (DIM6/NTAB) family NADH-FMN oxidoreductase RutF